MTINCKGKLVDLNTPRIMGILNLTPDSFYDGGKYKDDKSILSQVDKMLTDGATFIDIGAYSSRPNADDVPETEELNRITPIVELLTAKFPNILISVDTFRSKVAQECLDRGAVIINDITAGNADDSMMDIVAKNRVPYIMMHMCGTPKTMQQLTDYTDIVLDIKQYFAEKTALARAKGINDIILDVGFGFSKTVQQNYELLAQLDLFRSIGVPILTGISRKSMIYKILKTNAKNALNGTTVLNTIALTKGTNILRVHDVKEAMECISLISQLEGWTIQKNNN